MEQQKRYISVLDIGTSKVLALIGEVQDETKSTSSVWDSRFPAACAQAWLLI